MSQHLSPSFIQRQRERLELARERILDPEGADQPRDRPTAEVEDTGEEGAIEAERTREDALDANAHQQLADINRALEKIAEGSYERSDESDESIPEARLEAIPEANLTVEEVADQEHRRAVTGERDI